MKDRLRNLLSIRQQRKTPPVGAHPQIGTVLIRQDVTLVVDCAVPVAVWDWLVLSGWRTVPVKQDRRSSRAMPAGALAQLIAASDLERDQVHARLLEKAA